MAIELGGKTFACRVDIQGNIRGLIDPITKSIATNYDYTAFGIERRINLLEVYQSPWRYASKRFDADLGLINFGKRDYDPVLERWTTTDPAGFVDGTNLYAYLYNNPFRYVDPDGRMAMLFPLLMWGGAAGLTWVMPSLTTMLATALTYYIFQEACVMYDRYQCNANLEKRHTPDQEALNDLGKDSARHGISNSDADILLEWGEEYGFPSRDDRGKDHCVGGEHIHVGGMHVPVNK